jgi:manganese/iron transport system permease protein/iron/zinc/copper transport system permease protein
MLPGMLSGAAIPAGTGLAGTVWEPFRFEFFRNGLAVATLAGALCGLVGTFVVLRSMSYIGHGLSHAIFGGFAASSLIGVNVLIGAGVWGVASALAIGGVTRRRPIGSDAAIGVITTASFAIGLVLGDVFKGPRQSFDAALFGSILGVSGSDVVAIALVTVGAAAVVFGGYRRLLFSTFDPDVAAVSGVNVARWDALLMVVLATSILVTMQVVGATLLAATLVIPATVARMLTNSFARMLWSATGIGALCGFVGMVASYHLDWKSGPTIVLVGTVLFVLSLVLGGRVRRARVSHLGHVH